MLGTIITAAAVTFVSAQSTTGYDIALSIHDTKLPVEKGEIYTPAPEDVFKLDIQIQNVQKNALPHRPYEFVIAPINGEIKITNIRYSTNNQNQLSCVFYKKGDPQWNDLLPVMDDIFDAVNSETKEFIACTNFSHISHTDPNNDIWIEVSAHAKSPGIFSLMTEYDKSVDNNPSDNSSRKDVIISPTDNSYLLIDSFKLDPSVVLTAKSNTPLQLGKEYMIETEGTIKYGIGSPYNVATYEYDSMCERTDISTVYWNWDCSTSMIYLNNSYAQWDFWGPTQHTYRSNIIGNNNYVNLAYQNKYGSKFPEGLVYNSGSITVRVFEKVSAPIANFTASKTTGTTPFAVTFTDTSTNNPSSWAWDFDNNGTIDSTVQNPTYTYTVPGTYTVKLTSTNASGSDEESKTSFINVTSVSSAPKIDLTGHMNKFEIKSQKNNFTSIVGTFDVKNIGSEKYSGKVRISYYISKNDKMDNNDLLIKSLEPEYVFINRLTNKASRTFTYRAQNLVNKYLIIKIDSNNKIPESKENNNLIIQKIS